MLHATHQSYVPLIDLIQTSSHVLPDQDSNLNCQSQNLTYYHYTIGQ